MEFPSFADAVSPVTADGRVMTSTAFDGFVSKVLSPMVTFAVSLNVYFVSGVSPDTVYTVSFTSFTMSSLSSDET